MVTFEVVLGVAASLGVVTSALFGGGLFRQALKHNAEAAVAKFRQEQTDKKVGENDASIQKLQQEMALVKKDVEGFGTHILKLEVLPEILSKLSVLEALMQVMRESISSFRSERNDHDKHNS